MADFNFCSEQEKKKEQEQQKALLYETKYCRQEVFKAHSVFQNSGVLNLGQKIRVKQRRKEVPIPLN